MDVMILGTEAGSKLSRRVGSPLDLVLARIERDVTA
jgi:hypothetical protein